MITPPVGWDPSRFDDPNDRYVRISARGDEKPLRHPADAWRTVLRTGRDPDGHYTISQKLLPRLRAQELAEIRRDLAYKRERFAELHKEVRMRKTTPELLRRAERQLKRCEQALQRLQNDKRSVLAGQKPPN
jgi:hypothetical protein